MKVTIFMFQVVLLCTKTDSRIDLRLCCSPLPQAVLVHLTVVAVWICTKQENFDNLCTSGPGLMDHTYWHVQSL